MSTARIQVTKVFNENAAALVGDNRFIVNQGGSRSSKTYSLCQLFIVHCVNTPNERISIVRKTLPALRNTVMVDFFEVLQAMGMYEQRQHNKTNNTYTFDNGSIVSFFSTDDEQKLRGRKHSIVWANEANELLYDEFMQLNMRCEGKFFIDFNPSEGQSWIYELPRDEMIIIKSTYRDNPFLPDSIISQIEDLKRTDEALYQIYALGERSRSRINIYSNWEFLDEKPMRFQEYVYGLDFGYNHPTALVKVYYHEKDIYIEPVLYQSYLSITELISKMGELDINFIDDIDADHARPDIIKDLVNEGYNIRGSIKGVKKGIDAVKTFKIYAKNDENLMKEYDNYRWKKVRDMVTDDPVKILDDYMDAIQYAIARIKKEYYTNDAYVSF